MLTRTDGLLVLSRAYIFFARLSYLRGGIYSYLLSSFSAPGLGSIDLLLLEVTNFIFKFAYPFISSSKSSLRLTKSNFSAGSVAVDYSLEIIISELTL